MKTRSILVCFLVCSLWNLIEGINDWNFDVQGLLNQNVRSKSSFRHKEQALVISIREQVGYKFFDGKPKFVFLLSKAEELSVKSKIQNYINLIKERSDQMKVGVKLDSFGLPYDSYGTLDLGSFSNVKQIYPETESYGSEESSSNLFYVSSMLGKTKFRVSFNFRLENPHIVSLNLVTSNIDPNKKEVGGSRKKPPSVDLSRSDHGNNAFIQAQLDFDDQKMISRQKHLEELFVKNEQRRQNLLAYQTALGKIKLFGKDVNKILEPQKQAKFVTATNIARQRESQINS